MKNENEIIFISADAAEEWAIDKNTGLLLGSGEQFRELSESQNSKPNFIKIL